MRIAVGGFHIESSAFTPYRSGLDDFRVLEGQDLLKSYTFIAGRDASLEARREQSDPIPVEVINDVEWVPLVHMRALPGGPIDAEFYQGFHDRFMEALRCALDEGLDGVLLDIHGAALVEGIEDAEGIFASEVRSLVGPGSLIAATMDLHGNVSDRLFEACDLLTCYRTAPHIDAAITRHRAARVLVDSLSSGQQVYRAKVDVPILLPGEKTSTAVEPGKSLYQKIPHLINTIPDLLDVSIWMGFPWGDEGRCHGAVVALASSLDVARDVSVGLAEEFWSLRDRFEFVGPTASVDEAVRQALTNPGSPFFISDTGDNTGAGGVGDLTFVLDEVCHQHSTLGSGKNVLIAALYTPEIAVLAFDRPQSTFEVTLGINPATVFVRHTFVCPQGGRSAVLDIVSDDPGVVSVIVTERRTQYGTLDMFLGAGLQGFGDYDVFVVKMGYLEPDLACAAEGWVMAITPGAVDQDLARVGYSNQDCKSLTRTLPVSLPCAFDARVKVNPHVGEPC